MREDQTEHTTREHSGANAANRTSASTSKNAFEVLKERGFLQQVTDEDAVSALFNTASTKSISVYTGYDPTADSLHVGHLFTLMALSHLEAHGHRPIVVVGGGTAMVGDPSGKTELRQMLSEEQISENVEKIRTQIDTILDVSGGRTLVLNNADWILPLNYIQFLREIGRHFSVNRMLTAEAYKVRLEKGLSFIEFNYQLLQAYDFLELNRRYDCQVQMGGDDQWGNILAGVDLCRRMEKNLVHGMTFPLLMTASGQKMGKTAQGAVWLDAERLDPFGYYQYWVNTQDDDVQRMLGFFTNLPMPEIDAVGELQGAALNTVKSILAFEATKIVHGETKATAAHQGAMAGFGGRSISRELLPSSSVPRTSVAQTADLPTTILAEPELMKKRVIDLIVDAGMSGSLSEARRMVRQGAVKIGDKKIGDENKVVSESDLDNDHSFVVRVGKKRMHLFRTT